MISPAVERLIQTLQYLPGVGAKSAQRMAFHLLADHRDQGMKLAEALQNTLTRVRQCANCRIFTENEYCDICNDPKRDHSKLCIVQNTMDVVAFEHTSQFKGLYFVLHGVLSPIDGITANHLGLNDLVEYVSGKQFEEAIIATYATAEGEATAHYIAELLKQYQTQCTRLAYGIPHGGEFEYLNANTLSQALSGRSTI